PPAAPGRDTEEILCAAATGEIGALLVAGVEAADLPDPEAALAAVDSAGFVVSLELRRSEITDRADVVLPIAPVAEKAGTFLTWEGRERPFDAALTRTDAMPDLRVLNALAAETRPLGGRRAALRRRAHRHRRHARAASTRRAGRGDRCVVRPAGRGIRAPRVRAGHRPRGRRHDPAPGDGDEPGPLRPRRRPVGRR